MIHHKMIIIISPDDQHRPEYNRPGADAAAPFTVPAASRKCASEEFLQQFEYLGNLEYLTHYLDVIHPISVHKG